MLYRKWPIATSDLLVNALMGILLFAVSLGLSAIFWVCFTADKSVDDCPQFIGCAIPK